MDYSILRYDAVADGVTNCAAAIQQAVDAAAAAGGGREDTWYATNIEIVDYMADAARLQYTAAGDKVCNPNAQSIWVEVDGRHYEIPAGKTVALV